MLIWATMAILVLFSGYIGILNYWATQVVLVSLAILLSYSLSSNIRFASVEQSFGYGLGFIITGLFLDLIITTTFNPALFMITAYWLTYVAILITPIVYVSLNEQTRININIGLHVQSRI